MARARRSSSLLKGTCSGFGTMPLDTGEDRRVQANKTVAIHTTVIQATFLEVPQNFKRLLCTNCVPEGQLKGSRMLSRDTSQFA